MIFHLTLAHEWEAALREGEYRRSTIDTSLEDEGFIHCSFENQVERTADKFYRDRGDVLLLSIDTEALDAPVRVENLGGGAELYPHIYGPLPVTAVVSAAPYRSDG